jgi:hypothetical protein
MQSAKGVGLASTNGIGAVNEAAGGGGMLTLVWQIRIFDMIIGTKTLCTLFEPVDEGAFFLGVNRTQ